MGKTMLEAAGLTAITAQSGREAVSTASDGTVSLDCAIVDLTMPGMDGVATCHALREIAPDLPLIVSSGFDHEEAVGRFEGISIAAFLPKPYTVDALSRGGGRTLAGRPAESAEPD